MQEAGADGVVDPDDESSPTDGTAAPVSDTTLITTPVATDALVTGVAPSPSSTISTPVSGEAPVPSTPPLGSPFDLATPVDLPAANVGDKRATPSFACVP